MAIDREQRKLLAVAHLLSQGKQQKDIGDALGISQAEVSRASAKVRENKWLVTEVHFPDNISEIEKEEIRNLVFGQIDELKNKTEIAAHRSDNRVPIDEISVIYVSSSNKEPRAKFYRDASEYLIRLMLDSDVCAVSWGKTIAGLVKEISQSRCPKRDITFFPTSGEPMNTLERGISPTDASHQLADAFKSETHKLSLQGLPARVPSQLSRNMDVIQQFIRTSDDYNRIFAPIDGESPLVEIADTIITGVGDADASDDDPWIHESDKKELAENPGIKISSVSVGNIGGVWLPKPDARSNHKRIVEEFNDRWLGVKKQHFESCCKKAAGKKRPGVVVVAFEPEKAEILRASLGMVNRLIISQKLAERLLAILVKELD